MQCAHSNLDLIAGPTSVAEHPRPDHFNSKPTHLLHQSLEKLFTLVPQNAQDSKFSKPSQAHKVVDHHVDRLQQRCSEVSEQHPKGLHPFRRMQYHAW